MEAALLNGFVEGTPAADQEAARARSIESVDKKIKNMRGPFNKAIKKRRGDPAEIIREGRPTFQVWRPCAFQFGKYRVQ